MARIILLIGGGTGNYGVFGTEVSNMSQRNQVLLPFEQNISAKFLLHWSSTKITLSFLKKPFL
jgi:hypothetical protein